MKIFGRRKTDLIPVPEDTSAKAVLEINKFAELAVIGLASLFFGTLWFGVNESAKKLATIEAKLTDLPTRQDLLVITQQITVLQQQAATSLAERARLQADLRELEVRVRQVESKK